MGAKILKVLRGTYLLHPEILKSLIGRHSATSCVMREKTATRDAVIQWKREISAKTEVFFSKPKRFLSKMNLGFCKNQSFSPKMIVRCFGNQWYFRQNGCTSFENPKLCLSRMNLEGFSKPKRFLRKTTKSALMWSDPYRISGNLGNLRRATIWTYAERLFPLTPKDYYHILRTTKSVGGPPPAW